MFTYPLLGVYSQWYVIVTSSYLSHNMSLSFIKNFSEFLQQKRESKHISVRKQNNVVNIELKFNGNECV